MEEVKIVSFIVTVASILHTFVLPPWDFLDAYPRLQKAYKVFVYLVGYIAINGRSTIYPSISVAKSGGVNESVVNAETPKEVEAPKP